LRLFARHIAELGYAPDPALDADMADFPSRYACAPNLFLVAASPGGQLVGMAGLLNGEIRRVHVRLRSRQRGVARALVEELAERARDAGLKALRATVAESNQPSRRLFLACGFVATGKLPALAPAQDCEVFERELFPNQLPQPDRDAEDMATHLSFSAPLPSFPSHRQDSPCNF
jgi:ribosomal protein S18 acetylase RimI-like enzyme